MPQETKRSDRLIINPGGQETEPGRQASITAILSTGTMQEIGQGLVDPLLRGVIPSIQRPELFDQLAQGTAYLGELEYENDALDGLSLSGEDIANAIGYIDAMTRVRFPAYDVFNPRPQNPEGKLTLAQMAGMQARGLLAFYDAPGNISSVLNDKYRNGTQVNP